MDSIFGTEVKEIDFMGEKFKLKQYEISGEVLIILTGLMVVGKDYYKLMKQCNIQLGNKELWEFIEKKFSD